MTLRILAALCLLAAPLMSQKKSELYAAVGNDLTAYDIDIAHGTLAKRGTVTLPANIQEAWPHPSHRYLYVAWSDGGAASAPANGAAPKGSRHGISAFRIDPATGALTEYGKPVALPTRPIFITTDVNGTHIIAAQNDPSRLTVYGILPSGELGAAVEQPAGLDFGIYGHQVRADPSGKTIDLITRGNGPTATTPEDPGAIKIFSFRNGILSNLESIAPNKGFGFQVRHLDFHPSGKWAFVTLERQNQIQVYARKPDGTLSPQPLFVKSTLQDPAKDGAGQTAASLHFDSQGRFLYVANRGAGPKNENSISVFAINEKTGEPTLIQSIETHGYEPRTFTLDAAGKTLIVANQNSKDGTPASLAVFSIRDDGKLEYRRKYDMQTSAGRSLFWAGAIALP
ncbi:MAG TPA: beta-propeller fold lactonase family protein [Bryobacteraceae bacterium]|nr:beta-propeller fold lactonase family protein [Bryobacteraceae bacterium]